MKSVRMLKNTWIINLDSLDSLELLPIYSCVSEVEIRVVQCDPSLGRHYGACNCAMGLARDPGICSAALPALGTVHVTNRSFLSKG